MRKRKLRTILKNVEKRKLSSYKALKVIQDMLPKERKRPFRSIAEDEWSMGWNSCLRDIKKGMGI